MQPVAVVAVMLMAALPNSWSIGIDSQRPVRRNNIRAVLAGKLDPKFWPARGRRSDDTVKHPSKLFLRPLGEEAQRRQASDEEGPFWANRGRSIDDLVYRQTDVEGPFWANRGRSLEEEGPFWANRERAIEEEGPFWANRGRAVEDEGPFWANRGRSLEGEGPFWANRGRDADHVWVNKQRQTDGEGPFWANRGRSLEGEGPFWANRGRALNVDGLFLGDEGHPDQNDDERLRRDTLFVDEPGWVSLPLPLIPKVSPPSRRNILSDSEHDLDTFFGARGKKETHPKRELEANPSTAPHEFAGSNWLLRDARGSKINRALEKLKETQFWPSRGKKESKEKE